MGLEIIDTRVVAWIAPIDSEKEHGRTVLASVNWMDRWHCHDRISPVSIDHFVWIMVTGLTLVLQ